tara:strand:- start:1515 stop:1700 length:186 start_codon:yes stop_codon:yes gene_type:complete
MENTETILIEHQKKSVSNAITVGKTIGKIHNLKQAVKLDFNKPYLIAAIEELENQLDKIKL